MRRGMTLLDLLIALIIAALLLAIAVRSMGDWWDRLSVEQAARAVAAAHTRARIISVGLSRVSLLAVRADSLLVWIVEGSDTLPRWSTAGAQALGVALSGPSQLLGFAPTGVGFGASNATYTLTRGVHTRQVIVSRWGRVRIP